MVPGLSSIVAKNLSSCVLKALTIFFPDLGSKGLCGGTDARSNLGRELNILGPVEWNPLFRAFLIHAGMELSVVNLRGKNQLPRCPTSIMSPGLMITFIATL